MSDAASPLPKEHSRPWFGLILGAAGAWLLAFAREDVTFPTSPGDPGPWFVPTIAGILLVLGGIVELIQWWWHARRRKEAAKDGSVDRQPVSNRPMVILAAGVGAYLISCYAAGFSPSTLLFGTLLLRWLGSTWPAAVAVAVVEVFTVRLLFTRVFEVPLPERLLDAFS